MKIIDSGSFDVSPGELISVAIDKTDAPYASSDSLLGVAWTSPPVPMGLSAHGAFVAPGAGGQAVLTLTFDFVPAADGSFPPGDRYDVVIHGLPSEDARRSTIFAGGLQSRTFVFRSH
jgi:hypothetical protein